MKPLKLVLILFVFISSCKKTESTPTVFSEAALNDIFINLDGERGTLKTILEAHKGKKVLVDIWASWCKDCIKGMPKVQELQLQFPNIDYVFLSLDKTIPAWRAGVEKLDIKGDNYYMPNGKNCEFANFINIDWIPRYMVIDEKGNIALFKAIEADDAKVIELLK